MRIKLNLLEGKKQVQSILTNIPDIEKITTFILSLDPSKTKKYTDVLAKEFKKRYKYIINLDFTEEEAIKLVIDYYNKYYKNSLADLIPKAEIKNLKLDINDITEVSELINILNKEVKKITRSSFKKGFEGLVENKDYKILYEKNNIVAVMPFNWEASRVLASNYVGNCEGKWCISYQKTKVYWTQYTVEHGQAPVFFINLEYNENLDTWGKYAFMYSEEDYEIWDADDDLSNNPDTIIQDILNLSYEENEIIWQKALNLANLNIKNFNDGEVIKRKVSNFSLNNKNEFMIKITISEGDMEEYFSENVTGKLYTGREYFNTKEGKNFIKEILSSYEKNNIDIKECPDLINNTLIIRYDDETYDKINRRANSGEFYDDIGFLNMPPEYIYKNKITFIAIAKTNVDIEDEYPFFAEIPEKLINSDEEEYWEIDTFESQGEILS